ncbi:MAG: N-acetylneuraminate synthase family protein [Actinomycetes bacterium]|jgi:N-acetylneuraminate synthase|nr:N-acetylneuraminate synthase family protein [Actinomycetes bacterium]
MIPEKPPYLIAEIGVNYYDSAHVEGISPLNAAHNYVRAAAGAGADAVKFQSYKAETLASRNSPAYWDQTKEPTASQYELFKKFDAFGTLEYHELAATCKEVGVDFLSTPFDYESLDYLEDIVPAYKISSSDITNYPFLKRVAQKEKPIILSCGASTLDEVQDAYRLLIDEGCPDVSLLHCVLSYPTNPVDANLAVIQTLKTSFPSATIGYSDHVPPDNCMTTLLVAWLTGAEIIEKHFTLDKSLPGNDHYHAGSPDDFKLARKQFNRCLELLGNPEKAVLAAEEIPRLQARRSIVTTRSIKAGEVFESDALTCKRPGTGIPPIHLDQIIGKHAVTDLAEDSLLCWKDLSGDTNKLSAHD